MKIITTSLILILFSLKSFGSIWPPAFEYGISDFVSRLALVEDEKRLKEVSKELAKYIFESESDNHVSTKLSILTEQIKSNKAFDENKTMTVVNVVAENLYSRNAYVANFKVLLHSSALFVALTLIVDNTNLNGVLGHDLTYLKEFIPAVASWIFQTKSVLKLSNEYKKEFLDKLVSEAAEPYLSININKNSCVGILNAL